MEPIESIDDGCRLHLHVAPRASRTAIAGVYGERIKLQVAAPPVEGKANAAIEKYIAKKLGVSRSAIRWVSGEAGKRKSLDIEGVSAMTARERLGI